ncbi:MAG TPA: protein translocase subunit SecD [Candidatus Paceibacterota bacterium]|nr:protein translocase subunit SecD [Candidatus Paceibacterota bacterium]
MRKRHITAIIVLVLGSILSYGVFRSQQANAPTWLANHPFHLGLDLSGGSHLLYNADVSQLPAGQVTDSMNALRDVIERRINLFGVAEPTVQVETSSLSGTKQHRLSIELPGITDITKAIAMIGQTPFLEFRTQSAKPQPQTATVDKNGQVQLNANLGDSFVPTQLTGKYLKHATLEFNPSTGEPVVSLQFNDEGTKLFAQITKDNVGKVVAIYLDGQVISAPVVREAITGGQAQISGNFTPDEAKTLVGRLNSGALPVPISLASTQTIGAVLGASAVHAGVKAAVVGFLIIALFLILWYRLPGFVSVIALAIYGAITLTLYKLIPVTLTAAGIAGFIISIGMAVDANILIFERTREERARGRKTTEAIETGFDRAWTSIRDANIGSIIIAIILFWFGTSLIKGFALTFGLGVFISLLSAITITRVLLRALPTFEGKRAGRILFSSGFSRNQRAK